VPDDKFDHDQFKHDHFRGVDNVKHEQHDDHGAGGDHVKHPVDYVEPRNDGTIYVAGYHGTGPNINVDTGGFVHVYTGDNRLIDYHAAGYIDAIDRAIAILTAAAAFARDGS
jgi:hypothetical protein